MSRKPKQSFTPRSFTDSKGTRYFRDESGVTRRLDLKPWKGKSERRKCIKARRQDRALAAIKRAAQ